MCLALPAQVVAIQSTTQATVSLGGIKKDVSLELVPSAKVGDYVIIHVGFAIGLLDPEQAEETLRLIDSVHLNS